ncbi:hypothetical protein AO56_04080 [Mycobacterium tuberculosis M1955]|nr:hypothetical protein AO56_04080 [Mycobacterium tuberculosis M1955]
MTPVVRPKTPRGDGNWIALTGLALILVVVRPKTPRGDGNWIALTGLALILVVVRPKTPRGDGNLERVTADGTIETSRQTQNPERGRKPSAQHR